MTHCTSRHVTCQDPRAFFFPATCGVIRHVTRRNGLDPVAVGERIRALRGRTTQKMLAEALGVGTTAVMRWEGGKHAPDEENSRRLAAYFEEPLETFFAPQSRGSSRAPVGELEVILDRLLALPREDLPLIREVAGELANEIRRLSEKADRVADFLDGLATPSNGHQAGGTSG